MDKLCPCQFTKMIDDRQSVDNLPYKVGKENYQSGKKSKQKFPVPENCPIPGKWNYYNKNKEKKSDKVFIQEGYSGS